MFDEDDYLDTTPRARSGDPETSRVAAASVDEHSQRTLQRAVLRILREYGPLTDNDIALAHKQTSVVPFSLSGLRTRRHELVVRGLVHDSGRREVLESGRRAVVWEAVGVSAPVRTLGPETTESELERLRRQHELYMALFSDVLDAVDRKASTNSPFVPGVRQAPFDTDFARGVFDVVGVIRHVLDEHGALDYE